MYVATKPDADWLLTVQRKLYRQSSLAWQRPTSFTVKSTESPVHNERCTPGSGKGAS